MIEKLYMAVTPDRYELPLAVCRSADELGQAFGITGHTVMVSLCRKDDGRKRGAKFLRIEVEEDENEPIN